MAIQSGTKILMREGPRAIELLKAGDFVQTINGGPKRICWIHSCVTPIENDVSYAIEIKAGTLGPLSPVRDLIVSQDHRILVSEAEQLDRMFERPYLVRAKDLLGVPGVNIHKPEVGATWWNFAFERHEIVILNGLAVASSLLERKFVRNLPQAERSALQRLFGSMVAEKPLNGAPARSFLEPFNTPIVNEIVGSLEMCR